MEINEAIINETKNCNKDFSCLKNKEHLFCKVRRCINSSVHFIECIDDIKCSYRINYGDCVICSCPIRKEVFNKFHL